MILRQMQFLKTSHLASDFPITRKEIAIVGRSNVGKSSLINQLCHKKIAKTSKVPGKTKSIHFFSINDRFSIADLPGYGFAKISKKLKHSWSSLMDAYFTNRKELIAVLILIDCIAGITSLDETMIKFLEKNGLPYVIVVTKTDKLNQKQMHELKFTLTQKGFDEIIFVSMKKPLTKLMAYIDGLFK